MESRTLPALPLLYPSSRSPLILSFDIRPSARQRAVILNDRQGYGFVISFARRDVLRARVKRGAWGP